MPVEADGSAHFIVPANRNVYFEVLDRDHREIQRMRSVVCLKPGETRSCIGCHERRNMAPPRRHGRRGQRRPPSRPVPPPWGTQTVSFLRDVQPMLNARCVGCHTHDRAANRRDPHRRPDRPVHGRLRGAAAVPERGQRHALGHPGGRLPRPPYTYGSKVSRLAEAAGGGHHGVKLTEEERRADLDLDRRQRRVLRPLRDERTIGPSGGSSAARCDDARRGLRPAVRHVPRPGRRPHDTWWLSLNRRDVRQSRMLAAPLARSAGGWQRCGDRCSPTRRRRLQKTARRPCRIRGDAIPAAAGRSPVDPRHRGRAAGNNFAPAPRPPVFVEAVARPASAAAPAQGTPNHDHPREEQTMLNQDQVCIVTGGGKGIGKGIAKVLAAEGATVVVAGRGEDLLRQTAADIVAGGGQAAAWPLDITDRPGVAAFVRRVREQFGESTCSSTTPA